MSTTVSRPTPPLVELQAAAQALLEGRFREGFPGHAADAWTPPPGERCVIVLGCGGGVGTTTVAVAVATAAGLSRVVECCSSLQSGLVAASFSEMGESEGWLRGKRDQVTLERLAHPLADFRALPAPLPNMDSTPLTVLDAGGDLDRIRQSGWLGPLLGRCPLVVVTRASIPGVRRLESLLAGLEIDQVAAVAIVGPPRRRWPKGMLHSLGQSARTLDAAGRLISIPDDPELAVAGLSSSPLPAKTLVAGAASAALIDSFNLIASH